jgi:hypothetical protein
MTAVLPRRDVRVGEDGHGKVLGLLDAVDAPGAGVEVSAGEVKSVGNQPLSTNSSEPRSPDWLIVAPYVEPEHLLDLHTVDTPNRLLALALTRLTPATSDYAMVRYEDAFDLEALMSNLKSLAKVEGYRWTRQEFYVVEFRSRLKQNIDVDLLFKLDKQSHIEATQGGGLLKYWYGVPNAERRNLATCE